MLNSAEELRAWQDERAVAYSRYLEYLETDHGGISESAGFGSGCIRLKRIKSPPRCWRRFTMATPSDLFVAQKIELR